MSGFDLDKLREIFSLATGRQPSGKEIGDLVQISRLVEPDDLVGALLVYNHALVRNSERVHAEVVARERPVTPGRMIFELLLASALISVVAATSFAAGFWPQRLPIVIQGFDRCERNDEPGSWTCISTDKQTNVVTTFTVHQNARAQAPQDRSAK